MMPCLTCGGTILPPTIGGVPRGSCRCHITRRREAEMAKSKKRAKAQEQQAESVTPEQLRTLDTKLQEVAKEEWSKHPNNPDRVAEPKAPKGPKPIAFNPQGEVKAAKRGSKLAALIDALVPGATMEQLVNVLSQSGSKVDASGVRAWLTYDLKRTGLGVHQVEDQFFLVGTPLPHRDVTAKKEEAKVEAEPKLKKAAMTAARSRKAAKS